MEANEHRIIREKLDSLQSLPDDYTPNLSAKWDLVESSLPGRPAAYGRLRKALAIAAILLLLLFLGITYLNRSETARPSLATKEEKSIPVPTAPALPQAPLLATKEPVRLKKVKQDATVRQQPSTIKEYTEGEDAVPTIGLEVVTPPPVLDTPVLVTEPAVARRTLKKRFYQQDFGGALPQKDSSRINTVSREAGIHFRLFPSRQQQPDDASPSRFRLTQPLN